VPNRRTLAVLTAAVLAVLLVVLVVAVLTGGGNPPTPEARVRTVVTRFGEASARKDYQVICDELLAPSLVEAVVQYGLPCELALQRALGKVKNPEITLGVVTVHGDRASARVTTAAQGQFPSSDTLRLRRANDEWRIAALG